VVSALAGTWGIRGGKIPAYHVTLYTITSETLFLSHGIPLTISRDRKCHLSSHHDLPGTYVKHVVNLWAEIESGSTVPTVSRPTQRISTTWSQLEEDQLV